MANNPSLLDNVAAFSSHVPSSVTLSICFFVIIGNEYFDDPGDYTGIFKGVAGSVHHVKGYIATSDVCTTIGAGLTTSNFSCGGSVTDYDLLGNGEVDFAFYKDLAEYIRPRAEALANT